MKGTKRNSRGCFGQGDLMTNSFEKHLCAWLMSVGHLADPLPTRCSFQADPLLHPTKAFGALAYFKKKLYKREKSSLYLKKAWLKRGLASSEKFGINGMNDSTP